MAAVLLLAWCGLGASASAEPIANLDTSIPTDRAPDPRLDGVVRVIRADLGLTGALATDRYGPITLWITSGARAWSGTLVATYAEANGTIVRNVVAAATTPGRVTPVEIVVRLPAGVAGVTIEDGEGRTKATLAQVPAGRELPLNTEASGTALVATLGNVSLTRQVVNRIGMTLDEADQLGAEKTQAPPGIWPSVRVNAIQRVPQAWIAYDQCAVVITTSTALEALGERGRAPLLDWVRTGGHMVVVSDSASREWALAACGDAIELEDASTVDAPASLRGAIVQDRAIAPIPDFTIRTRLVRIRDEAWTPIWPILRDDLSSDLSLGAQGPVGLGFVTVFGGDPGRWTPITSTNDSIAIWRAVVTGSVERFADADQNTWMSGALAQSEANTRRWMLDRAFRTSLPNPRTLGFLLLTLIVGLAVALGPLDMLLLRRLNLRHRSHRSAFAWLAGASVLAYVTPLTIRSSDDAIARGVATDIVLDPGGSTEASSGITLVYAGTSTRVTLDGIGEGAWCNVANIEPTYYYNRDRSSRVLPPFSIVQSGTADGVRQGTPASLRVGQWTFRIAEDVQPARPQVRTITGARVERVGEDWRVTIDGLAQDDDITIQHCALRVLGQTLDVRLTKDDRNQWTGFATSGTPAIGPDPHIYDAYRRSSASTDPYRLDLPMTTRRTRAFDAYANCDGWSVVMLQVSRNDSDVRVREASVSSNSIQIIRIAVPTPDARRALDEGGANSGPNAAEHAPAEQTLVEPMLAEPILIEPEPTKESGVDLGDEPGNEPSEDSGA